MKIYAENLDPAALEQFESAMAQPFVVAGALMPDAHKGYSLPIGAVVSTKDKIVPAWVGYDVGCGVSALKLSKSVTKEDISAKAKDIFDAIYREVPVGFNKNSIGIPYSLEGLTEKGKEIVKAKQYEKALGTLGGGNHFIEIGADEEDNVWIVIHSGSRGVGHGIASHYMTIASTDSLDDVRVAAGVLFDSASTDMKASVDIHKYREVKARFVEKKVAAVLKGAKAKEGHFALDVNAGEGRHYIQDLNWCLEYALANREEMVRRIIGVISKKLNVINETGMIGLINRNHNHAVLKEGLWVHRKGATHAEEGMLGAIPGNMRDGTFIVRGKGNKDSLESSSHGAGRILGRKAAKKALNMEDFAETMQGITALVQEDTLDESPGAYKDIHEVIRLQKDLVEVIAHIKPIINIKG